MTLGECIPSFNAPYNVCSDWHNGSRANNNDTILLVLIAGLMILVQSILVLIIVTCSQYYGQLTR